MSVYVEKSHDDTCCGFQPGHTNAKLSKMALLHLFSVYHSSFCGPGITGGAFQCCIVKLDQR